jgi:hypothetical protein
MRHHQPALQPDNLLDQDDSMVYFSNNVAQSKHKKCSKKASVLAVFGMDLDDEWMSLPLSVMSMFRQCDSVLPQAEHISMEGHFSSFFMDSYSCGTDNGDSDIAGGFPLWAQRMSQCISTTSGNNKRGSALRNSQVSFFFSKNTKDNPPLNSEGGKTKFNSQRDNWRKSRLFHHH